MKTFYSWSLISLTGVLLLVTGCSQRPALPSETKKQDNKTFVQNNEFVQSNADIDDVKKQMNNDELPANINIMTKEQLLKAKDYYLALKYTDKAVSAIERLITLTTDQEILSIIRLELADLYFEKGSFEKAGKLYSIYLQHFPGSQRREYVEYKAILCRFYQMLGSDRDQTITKEALAFAHAYLAKADSYTEFVDDVLAIKKHCLTTLAENEINIFRTNMNLHNYKGAEKRLAYIKEHYLPYVGQDEFINLEIALANKQGNHELVDQKNDELNTLQSAQPSIIIAQGKKQPIDRF